VLSSNAIRSLWESLAGSDGEVAQGRRFALAVKQQLGISRDEHGRPCLLESVQDSHGHQTARMSPTEFGLRPLAEAIVGPEWANAMQPLGGSLGNDDPLFNGRIMEGGGPAVHPSDFLHISVWSSVVSGIIEARMLERYQAPEFVANSLVDLVPSRQKREKLIGVARTGKAARDMGPGDPHPRAQFGERWVDLPETVKRGLAVEVTREAVFYDRTTQVLDQAGSVGEILALNREERIWDVILGVSNTYTYNGTNYNTYLTSGNWINLKANELVDWTDVDEANQLFNRMTDQETQQLISIAPDTLLVMPTLEMRANYIMNAVTIEGRTDRVQVQPAVNEIRVGGNLMRGKYRVVSSPYAYQRAIAADGLNLDEAAAGKLWFLGNFKKAFVYVENWPASVRRATPDDYTMLDHDLVFAVFANESGVAGIRDPRFVVKNTQE
jgi:hypothetical protein